MSAEFHRVWQIDDGEAFLSLCHNETYGWFWLTSGDDERVDVTPEDLHDLAEVITRKVPKP